MVGLGGEDAGLVEIEWYAGATVGCEPRGKGEALVLSNRDVAATVALADGYGWMQ